MKFLFASDSFKGTLSSARIAELLTTAAKESFPDCTCTSIETADGGEGTTDAVVCSSGAADSTCGVRASLEKNRLLLRKTG